MQFIPARFFTPTSGRKVNYVVIHTMETPEGLTTAENVAFWFAGSTSPRASAHYCVDMNSVVQSVLEKDVAWAAPGANHDGIQIELAGKAGQTDEQWDDPYSQTELKLAALLVADICRRHNIPAVQVSTAGVLNGVRGITGHANVSQAFKGSDHWDPGPNFPWNEFIAEVQKALRPKPLTKWPVPIPAWFWEWAKWKLQGSPEGKRPASAPKLIPLWAWARLKALKDART